MEVIPAIDVLDGAVVRLAKGDYDDVTRYGDSPATQLEDWGATGAPMVHVVDLRGAKTGTPDRALWEALAATGRRFQLGGGLREANTAVAAIEAGAHRVVLGTAAVWAPAVVAETLERIEPNRIVAALDVRGGRAQGAGWLDGGRPLSDVARRVADQGIVRALVTGIDRDGMMTGPDLRVLTEVRIAAPQLRLIGSGGVGSLDDLRSLAAAGVEAAIVGRALYEGRFSYSEAIAAAQ